MIALTWIKHQKTTENYFLQFLWGFKVEYGNLVPIHNFCRRESILDVHHHWQITLDGKSPISAIVHQFPFLGWTFKFHLAKIQQTHVKSLNPLVSTPESLIISHRFDEFLTSALVDSWEIPMRSPGSPAQDTSHHGSKRSQRSRDFALLPRVPAATWRESENPKWCYPKWSMTNIGLAQAIMVPMSHRFLIMFRNG